MTLGNPKMVAGLVGVILLFAVLDGASYLRGSQGSAVSPTTPEAQKPATPVRTSELPTTVTGNPFFHPALLTKPMTSPPPTRPVAGSNPASSSAFSPVVVPPLPGAITEPIGPPTAINVVPTTPPVEPKRRTITIGATVVSGAAVALISIDGNPSRPFQIGDLLASGVRLAQIADGFVAVIVGGKTLTLHVGEKLQI